MAAVPRKAVGIMLGERRGGQGGLWGVRGLYRGVRGLCGGLYRVVRGLYRGAIGLYRGGSMGSQGLCRRLYGG